MPRDIDDELFEALRDRPFVLVVGDSKAGKSRTAYQAALRLRRNGRRHDPRVLVPKGTAALCGILDLDPPLDLRPEPALLWLDDLTEGELASLSPDVLDRLRGMVAILGTITAQRRDRVETGDSEIGRSARQALARATIVRLETTLTDRERTAAEDRYPHEHFEAGIGEQLVAADQLVQRYDDARQGAQPHGWALVQAAIDWVRMDVGRPIRRSELTALYPLYLAVVRPQAEPAPDLSPMLDWAHTPIGSCVALLQRSAEAESYLPFDYLVAVADGQDGRKPQAIPDRTWHHLPTLTSAPELAQAFLSAYYRHLPDHAQSLLESIIATDHADEAPKAMRNLGWLLAEQGQINDARNAYQRAIATDHPDEAPRAMINLAWLLAERLGDIDGARDAYQRAIATNHPDEAPRAMINLAWLLAERFDDIDGARDAYQRAIATNHPDEAPRATAALARLEESSSTSRPD